MVTLISYLSASLTRMGDNPTSTPTIAQRRSHCKGQKQRLLRAYGTVVTRVRNSRYARTKQSLRAHEAVVTRIRSSRYARDEQPLRAYGTAVTRVRNSRYAHTKQSLRAYGAVVTRARSSRYARAEQSHEAVGFVFCTIIWKIFYRPCLARPKAQFRQDYRRGPPHHAARQRAWQAGLREPPPPDAGRRGIRSSA